MKRVGVFIVGTSPLPIYISMKYYLSEKVDKIYFLSTEDNEKTFGTRVFAERLKEAFNEEDIEIISIDRSDIGTIKRKLNNLKEAVKGLDDSIKLYLDYTGGTKLQSAVIREFFESNSSVYEELILSYVDGYTRNIIRKLVHDERERKIKFSEIEGNEDQENIFNIAKLHGYKVVEGEKFDVLSLKEQHLFTFDNISIQDFILEFNNKFQYDIKGGKNKVKLELFNNLTIGERVGGIFSIFDFNVDDDKVDCYQKLRNELFGVNKKNYEDRLYFNGE